MHGALLDVSQSTARRLHAPSLRDEVQGRRAAGDADAPLAQLAAGGCVCGAPRGDEVRCGGVRLRRWKLRRRAPTLGRGPLMKAAAPRSRARKAKG